MAALAIRTVRVSEYRHQYPSDLDNYRPAYVYLDLENGRAGARWDGNVGPGEPAEVFLGREQRWYFDPRVSRDGVRKMLRHMRPLLQAAYDSSELWHDSCGNYRGSIDGDLDDQIQAIADSFGFDD